MVQFDFAAIEKKWRETWEDQGLYRAEETPGEDAFYQLTMLPYPSGDLHIGHWFAMAPADALARYHRMNGKNVLFPMGFDAFGLPAENAAIKRGIHPAKWTFDNIANMQKQLERMGTMFDWRRQVITCEPEYYRWNQWFFLKFYERGLAYKELAPVDWCPGCKTTLAREQVVGEERLCERCDTPVVRKELSQWFFRITDYADQLLEDLDKLDWPERVKTMQRNWIGRSEGVQFALEVEGGGEQFEVFTTRIDTIYGASFAVLAPEHPLVDEITTPAQREAVDAYQAKAARASEIDRLSTERERDGVFTGAYAINPFSGEKMPIWIADYVLMSYGTGAIMAVPAHDDRDFDFAQRYDLPVPVVVEPLDGSGTPAEDEAFGDDGRLVNSGPYTGLTSSEAREVLADELEDRGLGGRQVNYRLRDWLISRQRYWGTPIPIVYCDECGTVPVPEDQLPVELPDDAEFKPTGESPLLYNEAFLNTSCPECGGPAKRETDTMDTFVDSSWYQYRYLSPHDDKHPFSPEAVEYWGAVDFYSGGVEHAVMHLLYTRFFTRVLRDMGLVDFDEPMLRLFNQGIILGEDGNKMSKSRGNVVAPDDLTEAHGVDAVRAYLMFIGPWDQGGPFDRQGIGGVERFLNRIWRLVTNPMQDGKEGAVDRDELERQLHATIKKVTADFQSYSFNTAIAAMMELVNSLVKAEGTSLVDDPLWQESLAALLKMLAPVCPYMTEELWYRMGQDESVHLQAWPDYDEAKLQVNEVEIAIQVNGKVRDRVVIAKGIDEDSLRSLVLERERVREYVAGPGAVRKWIYVPNKLVNIVAAAPEPAAK